MTNTHPYFQAIKIATLLWERTARTWEIEVGTETYEKMKEGYKLEKGVDPGDEYCYLMTTAFNQCLFAKSGFFIKHPAFRRTKLLARLPIETPGEA